MKILNSFKQIVVLALACVTLGIGAQNARADDYSFKVENKTDKKITKVLVSEDGKKYGGFDIGSGIAAGKTVTLVWAKSTNNEACKQYVKAVYEGGEESEPAKFDFCETDLEIVFE